MPVKPIPLMQAFKRRCKVQGDIPNYAKPVLY